MKLYAVPRRTGGLWWCGPAVVAAITGRPFEEIRAAFNACRDRRPTHAVTGTRLSEVSAVLRQLLGPEYLVVERMLSSPLPTFRRWRLDRRNPSPVTVVSVGRHWVAVAGNTLVDTQHLDGVHVSHSGYDRRRVSKVIHVWPKGNDS